MSGAKSLNVQDIRFTQHNVWFFYSASPDCWTRNLCHQWHVMMVLSCPEKCCSWQELWGGVTHIKYMLACQQNSPHLNNLKLLYPKVLWNHVFLVSGPGDPPPCRSLLQRSWFQGWRFVCYQAWWGWLFDAGWSTLLKQDTPTAHRRGSSGAYN